ncbi:hypothetical protein DFP72DRAFT_1115848 [Ephemerocybe angulata]|uniref:CxC2-like cysteine cluster KDZ transposase-associated domain-containing protein n=1 Tax=Ephemerocybe angulata TaxID=980116 RepID=A0A8H6LUB6_9AGAR|nr:hypothetical protein DFP72DRAFT_1115848 [Tulosesus angulatus]
MPRAKKYHTPEEKAAAKREKSSRYYTKNRDLINEKARLRYRRTHPTPTSVPGVVVAKVTSVCNADKFDRAGYWQDRMKAIPERLKRLTVIHYAEFLDSTCSNIVQGLVDPFKAKIHIEDVLTQATKLSKSASKYSKEILATAGAVRYKESEWIVKDLSQFESSLEEMLIWLRYLAMSHPAKRPFEESDPPGIIPPKMVKSRRSTVRPHRGAKGPRTAAVFTLKDSAKSGRAGQRRVNYRLEDRPTEDDSSSKGGCEDLEAPDASSGTFENGDGLAGEGSQRKKRSEKRRVRNYENMAKVLEWIPFRQTFLDELLRHDGHGDFLGNDRCSKCDDESQLFKCRDCWDGAQLCCRGCTLAAHSSLPFHHIEYWEDTHFEKTCLQALGLRIQLGHGGGACPNPIVGPKDFNIFDTSGVHPVNIDFCGCSAQSDNSNKSVQLLRSSLFPATLSRPQTAFTFNFLDTFHQLTLQAKTTVYDYYNTIIRRSDPLELKSIPSRCNDFHRAFRFWRVLVMFKRLGRGNDPTGVTGTQSGELTIECPACPHPEKNLPSDWAAAGALLYLYTLFLAVDANFKLKGKARKIKDVELISGLAAFVEEGGYQQFLLQHVNEPEINTCHSEHDAIVRAAVRCTPGYDVTGAGLVICSRHGLVQPNGAGDLQKGEKYANMDYIILSALVSVAVLHVVITYDIACQWSKNLMKRNEKLPKEIQLNTSTVSISSAVPSWHINGHGSDCQINYALAYREGAARTCGDEIESTWSQTNVLGASVREMASGGRHESLNDHWNGANFRKKVQLRTLLAKKLREATKMPPTRRNGSKMFSIGRQNPSKYDNPYADVKLEATLQDVRLQLNKEDAEEAGRGTVSAHQTSVSHFLMTGLDLEEQQRSLIEHLKGNKLTTSKQKADLEEKRTGLQRRINQFRPVQLAYTPCVASLLPVLDATDPGETVTPEKIPLHLPSSLSQVFRDSIPDLVGKEQRLREAQCDDALSEIRRQRRILTGLVQFKKLNLSGQGNKPNTRVRSLYNRIQSKITRAHLRYQVAREALCILAPNGAWCQRLQMLKTEDIRGPGKDSGTSNGRYIMSWIWLVQRAQTEGVEALEGDELDESLRVEWLKSRARLRRWEEEYLLVQEEMRRTIAYLDWEASLWSTRASAAPFKGPDVAHGIAAYAAKRASLSRALRTKFSDSWVPLLTRLKLQPQWITETSMIQSSNSRTDGHNSRVESSQSRMDMHMGGQELEFEEAEEDDDALLLDGWYDDDPGDDEDEDGDFSNDFELDDQ